MLELLKPFWMPIAKYGAIAAGFFLFWLQARKSGEATIKQQNIENTLEGVEARDKIEITNLTTSDDKLDKLRSKWQKP